MESARPHLLTLLDPCEVSNLIINIFKIVKGDISKKDYKNKQFLSKKELKTVLFRVISLSTLSER